MHEKSILALLAALFVAVAGVGATETAAPAAADLASPALAAEFTPGPACTESADVEAVLAEIAPQPSAAEPIEALTGDAGWYKRCWPSCFPCGSDYDCPFGESCRTFQTCP